MDSKRIFVQDVGYITLEIVQAAELVEVVTAEGKVREVPFVVAGLNDEENRMFVYNNCFQSGIGDHGKTVTGEQAAQSFLERMPERVSNKSFFKAFFEDKEYADDLEAPVAKSENAAQTEMF